MGWCKGSPISFGEAKIDHDAEMGKWMLVPTFAEADFGWSFQEF